MIPFIFSLSISLSPSLLLLTGLCLMDVRLILAVRRMGVKRMGLRKEVLYHMVCGTYGMIGFNKCKKKKKNIHKIDIIARQS